MKLAKKQDLIISKIFNILESHKIDYSMYGVYSIMPLEWVDNWVTVFRDDIFDDDLISDIKLNFKVLNILSSEINDNNIKHIRFVICILKKIGYICHNIGCIDPEDNIFFEGKLHNAYINNPIYIYSLSKKDFKKN